MTTIQALGPYESRSVYRDLHTGPTGREWMRFVAECNHHPHERDGAARSAGIPPTVVAASHSAQPAPSPQATIGGAR